jgi:hypothetical protein
MSLPRAPSPPCPPSRTISASPAPVPAARTELAAALAALEIQVREILAVIAVARASNKLETASEGGRVLLRLLEARVALTTRLAALSEGSA